MDKSKTILSESSRIPFIESSNPGMPICVRSQHSGNPWRGTVTAMKYKGLWKC